MCGRYGFVPDDGFADRFDIAGTVPAMAPEYNAAPTVTMPVIVRHSPNSVEFMRWGLVPSWANDPAIGNRMINARAETLTAKPAFRQLFSSQRCLVPNNGFYEWARSGKTKIPYWFSRKDGGYLSFVGLYAEKQLPEGGVLKTYTIITTRANTLVGAVHERMPVVLTRKGEDMWLDPDISREDHMSLLVPYEDDGSLQSYKVSRRVNDASADDPELIEPVSE